MNPTGRLRTELISAMMPAHCGEPALVPPKRKKEVAPGANLSKGTPGPAAAA